MRGNSYHNSTHAADVLHATAFFLDQVESLLNVREVMTFIDLHTFI